MTPTTDAGARALDASLDRAALADAAARRSTLELLTEVLETEARVAALAEHGQALRAELLERGRAYRETEGMAPTWRAPIGQVIVSDPKARVGVTDREAFTAWAVTEHPAQVAMRFSLPLALGLQVMKVARDQLPELGQDAGVLEVDATWEKALLKGCAVQGDAVFAPETGAAVDGVGLLPAGRPTLSVRPDPETKARLIAEVRTQVLATLPRIEAAPLEVAVQDAPVADAVDVAVHPEDLVVDPAEGVIRAQEPFQAGLVAEEPFQTHAELPREEVWVIAPDALGDHDDAGAAPDYADVPVASAEDGPRWHAQRMVADPMLSFHLHSQTLAALQVRAGELGLAQPWPAGRTELARELLARVEALTAGGAA